MRLIETQSKQKLRGGFYTPEAIANFILKWAINGDANYDILEPSVGDGVFLKQLKVNEYKYKSITAVEIDEKEAKKAEQIILKNTSVLNMDFHTFCNFTKEKYDLIVGNPPYIRYQYFNRHQQNEAEKIFKKVKIKYSKLTNAWVSFVIGASILLKEKGKIGFVLPAEILQVSYAKPLREFISTFFNKISIVSFKKLVFPEIQQEVVLLLCEKNTTGSHLIEHVELKDINGLLDMDVTLLKSPAKRIDFKSNKWTFYFLDQKEIDFLEKISRENSIPMISDYTDVEVGITTGANSFFTVPATTVKEFGLENYARPLVGRSVQVNSPRFTKDDWEKNVNSEARAFLLAFPKLNELKNNEKALEYLFLGERENIHKGYKCGIRDEWQIVPSLWIPDAFFIRRNNHFPKLIINEANAYSTDTMHRLKLKTSVSAPALAASFFNSLSFAYSEISGRSYGGGVLELMPGEVKKIRIPYREQNAALIEEIDIMMRKKYSIFTILDHTNNLILKKGYGFAESDIKIADNIWRKLSSRRLNRGKKTSY
ncbi:Eco57I restriction-modification methylase domain-containing protein [Acidobacteriota bacterium]